MSDSPEPAWDLVMPFVCVTSNGGPYDDEAFVAGYRLGQLDHALSIDGPYTTVMVTCRPDDVAQVDLIAMRYRWKMGSAVGSDDAEWVTASIRKDGSGE